MERPIEAEPGISTAQVFLPFYNPIDDSEGWMFGLPPTDVGLGSADELELSIKILTRGGDVREVHTPMLRMHTDEPPEPVWAWVAFETGTGIVHARPSRPIESQGSMSLEMLPKLERKRMYTRAGALKNGVSMRGPDLAYNITCGTSASGQQVIRLGEHDMAEVSFSDGQIDWIRPMMYAYQLDLWTAHIARIVETRARRGQTL